MNELLPWHESQWQGVLERMRSQNLPHALLLTGPRGIGKNQFAILLAHSALCEQPIDNGLPCGTCKRCELAEAGTHPDVRITTPEEEGKKIIVNQVRDLTQYLSLKAHYGDYKLAIITPAEQMNINAANSLLKTLEEPPAKTVLILVTDRPSRLPATIRSRCQRIEFFNPAREDALAWLKPKIQDAQESELLLDLAEGAPLTALEIFGRENGAGELFDQRVEMLDDLGKIITGQSDPVVITEKWLKFNIKESLYWIYSWYVDMARLKVCNEPPYLSNRDMRQRLGAISNNMELSHIYQHLDRINQAIQLADGQINTQLLIEDMLIALAHGKSRKVA